MFTIPETVTKALAQAKQLHRSGSSVNHFEVIHTAENIEKIAVKRTSRSPPGL